MRLPNIDSDTDNKFWLKKLISEKSTNKFEIDLETLQKAKSKQRVWVKPTSQKKGYYRTQEVGQKEIEKKPPRKDTGKIASLPEDIKKEILDLRRLGYSGAKIKESIEGMISHETRSIELSSADRKKLDALDWEVSRLTQRAKAESDPAKAKGFRSKRSKLLEEGKKIAQVEEVTYVNNKPIGRDLVSEGVIDIDGKLKVTGQSLVDWAKARGVESTKKRKTVKAVEEKAKEIEEKRFKEANEKLARLQTENKRLQEQLDRERKSKMESDSIRDKLRNENYILREKLKSLK